MSDKPHNSPPDSTREIDSLERRRNDLLRLQELMTAKLKARPNDFGVRTCWGFMIVGGLIGWMRTSGLWSTVLYGLAFWIAGMLFAIFALDSAAVQSKIAISLYKLGEGRISKWLMDRALTIR